MTMSMKTCLDYTFMTNDYLNSYQTDKIKNQFNYICFFLIIFKMVSCALISVAQLIGPLSSKLKG